MYGRIRVFAQSADLYQILHAVDVLDMFFSFDFQKDPTNNVGTVGGWKFLFLFEKAHCLYNSLLLPHKPW